MVENVQKGFIPPELKTNLKPFNTVKYVAVSSIKLTASLAYCINVNFRVQWDKARQNNV